MSLEIVVQVHRKIWGLTPRESAVFRLICQGMVANKKIAELLDITESTVQHHLESIGRKSGYQTKSQILAASLRNSAKALELLVTKQVTPRVALVDDDPDVLAMMADMLSHHGIDATTYPDASTESLNAIRALRPEVLVCDFVLPNSDGIKAAKGIDAQDEVDPSIIIVTGYPVRIEERKNHVPAPVLFKPLDVESFVAAVWEAALSYRIRRSLKLGA